MVIPIVDVNYWAVLVCAVISMVVGSIWFGPLFGKVWMKNMGYSSKDMKKSKKNGMGWRYLLAFIGSLVMFCVVGHFVKYAGASTFVEGMKVAFGLWIGLVVPVVLGNVLWEGRKWSVYFITVFYYLVLLLIAAGILAVW